MSRRKPHGVEVAVSAWHDLRVRRSGAAGFGLAIAIVTRMASEPDDFPDGSIAEWFMRAIAVGWEMRRKQVDRLLASGLFVRAAGTHWRPCELFRYSRKSITPRMRRAVIARDGMACGLCGLDVPLADIHFDHIIPVARGGLTIVANLRVTHSQCNLRRPRVYETGIAQSVPEVVQTQPIGREEEHRFIHGESPEVP